MGAPPTSPVEHLAGVAFHGDADLNRLGVEARPQHLAADQGLGHPVRHGGDEFMTPSEKFNEAGELARTKFGLQFFYHNHDFDFSNKQANGAPLYDILLNESSAE